MLSKVNFFISKMHESCKVSERDWYVTIFNCDKTLLEYCGKDFIVIHAPCGHVEVQLPPGKYMAVGVWGFWQGPDGKYWGNHFTHKSIFQVGCGAHACVWLYNPSVHECGIIWDRALNGMRTNLDQAEADLNAQGVDPGDPRFVQINDMRNAIDTNLPAVQAVRNQADQFFADFVQDVLAQGADINREELIGNPDPAMMDEMVKTNSTRIPEDFNIQAQVVGSLVAT
jgi:hypothetical protein